MGTVVKLRERAPEWELARLNRETGLTFARLPVSLLPTAQSSQVEQETAVVIPCDTTSQLTARR